MVGLLIIILISFLTISLGVVVFVNNFKSYLSRIFLMMTFWIAIWQLSNFFENGNFNSSISSILLRIDFASAIMGYCMLILFCFNFPQSSKKTPRYLKLILYSSSIILALLSFTDLIIKNINFSEGIISFQNGSLWPIYAGVILIFFISGFGNLIYKLFRLKGIERIQIIYVLIGCSISAGIALIINLFLSDVLSLEFLRIGIYGMMFFIFFTAYAIIRHQLMNIKVITSEVLSILLVGSSLIGIFTFNSATNSTTQFAIKVFIFLFSLVLAVLLVRSVLLEVKSRKQIEKLATDLKTKNVHLEKLLQMRTEFLDIASHQLKTPISVIRGTISMFEEGSMEKLPEVERKKFFHNIAVKADKLNAIISDILRASEMDTDEFKIDSKTSHPEQIEDIIKSVSEQLLGQANAKNVQMTIEAPKQKLPKVMTSGEFLEQAIYNLVDNAIKYTQKGFVKISLSQEAKNIIIKIQDSGIGIPANDQKKMFDKFARATNAVNMYADGSGLGLFIVKKIIEAHKGGQVSVQSEEGKGTTFTISLPAILSKDKILKTTPVR